MLFETEYPAAPGWLLPVELELARHSTKMFSLALAVFSTLPLDANNCTILTTSSCVNGGSSPLGPLRNASLSCLRRFADATSDFGTRDNERWAEYAPTCAVWDGVPFGVAEPLNAFSSLAYDELLCVANLSFMHTALQLPGQ